MGMRIILTMWWVCRRLLGAWDAKSIGLNVGPGIQALCQKARLTNGVARLSEIGGKRGEEQMIEWSLFASKFHFFGCFSRADKTYTTLQEVNEYRRVMSYQYQTWPQTDSQLCLVVHQSLREWYKKIKDLNRKLKKVELCLEPMPMPVYHHRSSGVWNPG